MTTLLHIDASARGERSLSRKLSAGFIQSWIAAEVSAEVIVRDVGTHPPPFVTEDWIRAVFTPVEQLSTEQSARIRLSDTLIDEIERADVIVIGSPMYNYGMPAALKSWFDQVIRIGKTFTFDLARGDFPLEPIMSGKTLVILSSRGEFGFGIGGVRETMNHLETHIQTCAHYLGVEQTHVITIDYQEFADARHEASIAEAFEAIEQLVMDLTSCDA
ncbi:NAD(P)H-dependent oxidoreductase [Pseudomonas sp. St316]|uniref:FMN-dependent NADH-azoreductase n=1 Tax=Pseudomonas sp. St316 TaxID=2678257 RepID=UPI001BB416E7|nr:NAD(P)H-dependent oxidoreductase [Pseudomonas sp. St316]BBP58632.1 FMN-dependent NADH-azoreductase [Pseudomonas sp. St316]